MYGNDAKYSAEEINKRLVGGKITDVVVTPDNDAFGFIVKRPKEPALVCWVDCDPEGNGPGFLNIEVHGQET